MRVMQKVEMDVDKRPASVGVVKQRLQEIVSEGAESGITAAHALYVRPLASPSTPVVASTPGSSASFQSARQVMYSPSSSLPASQGKGGPGAKGFWILALAILMIGTCVFSVPHSSTSYHSYSDTQVSNEVSTPDLTATVNALTLGEALPITDAGEQTGPIAWSP